MPLDERRKIVEHRVSRTLYAFGEGEPGVCFVIRLWVESEPQFGGVESATLAVAQLDEALAELGETWDKTCGELAEALFEAMPSANSVEVCDGSGNGVTIHRDWP